MLQALGIFEWFDDFLFYHGEFKHKMLEHKIKKYEQKGVKRYEMAIVGGNITRDIVPGANCAIRTIFFCAESSKEDYEGLEHCRPDFDLLGHNQWSSTLMLLDKDIEYIESHLSEASTSSYLKLKNELQSQNMINIGVCTNYTQNATLKMVNNDMLQHSSKIQFKAVNLDIPLEHQTPLGAIIFKLLGLYGKYFDEDTVDIIDKANKF